MWWTFFSEVRKGRFRLQPMTWVAAIAAVLYTISPIDLIPDPILTPFLGPLGILDDLGLWGVLVMLVTREKHRWEVERHQRRDYRDAEYIDVNGRDTTT